MTYIDVAIYAVPTANKDDFATRAAKYAPLFTKYGALSAVDCWGVDIKQGAATSLPKAVECEDHETVAYSHVIWPSKTLRDQAMPKIMAEMKQMATGQPMPFDGARMIYGGFTTLVET
ncbi:MAG: DUF1428 domain-containing protein [bacterium]